jgi:2'-5' RNA ligase
LIKNDERRLSVTSKQCSSFYPKSYPQVIWVTILSI